jgi:hypothetical protein
VGPGTGKSQLLVVLERAAVDAGFRVRSFRAGLLVDSPYSRPRDNSVGGVIHGGLRRSDLDVSLRDIGDTHAAWS